MKKILLLILAAVVAVSFASCSAKNNEDDELPDVIETKDINEDNSTVDYTAPDSEYTFDDYFTAGDLSGEWDDSSASSVTLNGTSAESDSKNIKIRTGCIAVTGGGTYVLRGELHENYICVDAEDEAVQLVLDGVDITSEDFAPLYLLSAEKVTVTLAEGSENRLANTGAFVPVDSNNVDGVIFSKCDLVLNGSGALEIATENGHGVVCKDDLAICGGSYKITSSAHAFQGKDSLAVAGGDFEVKCGKDAFHAENSDDLTRGQLFIADGSFKIESDGDAISAVPYLTIEKGTFDIVTGGGADQAAYRDDSDQSSKGIKSKGALTINGGSFKINAADDALHTKGGALTVNGGTFTIASGDDAVKGGADVYLVGGDITVTWCVDGVKGKNIFANGANVAAVCFKTSKTPGAESSSAFITAMVDTGSAGEHITLSGGDGEIAGVDSTGGYNMLFFAGYGIESGTEYTVVYGDSSGVYKSK